MLSKGRSQPGASEENIPISVNVIIECQLFRSLNISLRKNSHPHVVSYGPLGHIAIWITAVICKTSDSSTFRRIDKLIKDNQLEM